jgi:hypothetical protein
LQWSRRRAGRHRLALRQPNRLGRPDDVFAGLHAEFPEYVEHAEWRFVPVLDGFELSYAEHVVVSVAGTWRHPLTSGEPLAA